jgi:hypothetical protein
MSRLAKIADGSSTKSITLFPKRNERQRSAPNI